MNTIELRVDVDRTFHEPPQKTVTITSTDTWHELSRRILQAYRDEPVFADPGDHLCGFWLPNTMRTNLDKSPWTYRDDECRRITCFDQQNASWWEYEDADGLTKLVGDLKKGDSFWFLWDFGSTTHFRCRVQQVTQLHAVPTRASYTRLTPELLQQIAAVANQCPDTRVRHAVVAAFDVTREQAKYWLQQARKAGLIEDGKWRGDDRTCKRCERPWSVHAAVKDSGRVPDQHHSTYLCIRVLLDELDELGGDIVVQRAENEAPGN